MTTVQITLPGPLAQEALSQDAFFAAMARMEQVTEPPAMTPEEVAGEIRALRAERRAKVSA